jgi:sulfatase modifying factor 1
MIAFLQIRDLNRCVYASVIAICLAVLAVRPAHAVTIDWVTVGNPGNTGQTNNYTNGGTLTFGAVNYTFRLMKFEWTNTQYAAFLNAIDPEGTNPNGVYNSSMSSNAKGGITNSGTMNGSRYTIKPNMGNKPVVLVSWWDAARVANWLHNGALTYGVTNTAANAPQNTGAYSVGTATNGTPPAKNPDALYWIPTESEWFKAAYYDPTRNSGSGGYSAYGNGFDTAPTPVTASQSGDGLAAPGSNFANYASSAIWNGQTGNVTTVGTNGSANFYGAFDMSGNVWELNDLNGSVGTDCGLRGGDWGIGAPQLSASHRTFVGVSGEYGDIGFRLAAVPEPSTYAMALAGLACGGDTMFRRRKRA